jgi:hypothetical protein
MKKFYFICILICFTRILSGQAYLYNEFSDKQQKAHRAHIKTIKEYSYKRTSASRGKILQKEEYDSTGNITYKWERTYRKNYEETKYFYDNEGRIIKIIGKDNREDYWSIAIISYYPNSNNILSIVNCHGLATCDTIRYVYRSDGKVNYSYKSKFEFGKLTKYDTTYYNYSTSGLKISPVKNDTSDYIAIRDQNGCIIGYQNMKYTQKCDSACRVLSYKDEFEWGEFRYKGDNRIEEKFWDGSGKFSEWNKYEYDKNGFVKQQLCLNKKGKIKEVRKTIYEYYSQ